MRHNSNHHTVRLCAGNHVLNKHQIALLASLRSPPIYKTVLTLHLVILRIVLREWWISNNTIKLAYRTIFLPVGIHQSVSMLNVGILDVVHDHVHLADRPYRRSVILSKQCQLATVATLLLDILLALDEHTTASDSRIVDFHILLRLDDSHHQLNDR